MLRERKRESRERRVRLRRDLNGSESIRKILRKRRLSLKGRRKRQKRGLTRSWMRQSVLEFSRKLKT